MQLSNRLGTIVKYVPQGSKVVDVGTDHAYIPIYLIKNNRVKSCIATDINKGPLIKAEHNMKKYGISQIELRHTPGLRGITADEAEVIMISGMGGYLIRDILKEALPVVREVKRLILQPQQDVDVVRRFLHAHDFKIDTEDFAMDDGKYYPVIIASRGQEHYDHDYEYIYGKCLIQNKAPLFVEWLNKKEARAKEIYEHINGRNSEQSEQRKKELEDELAMHSEVMKCLN